MSISHPLPLATFFMKRKTKGRSKRTAQPQGLWERAYKKHCYWMGEHKVAEIVVRDDLREEERYVWSCPAANMGGYDSDLGRAKKRVQEVVATGAHQLDLFQQD